MKKAISKTFIRKLFFFCFFSISFLLEKLSFPAMPILAMSLVIVSEFYCGRTNLSKLSRSLIKQFSQGV